jgi:hypothetical protein
MKNILCLAFSRHPACVDRWAPATAGRLLVAAVCVAAPAAGAQGGATPAQAAANPTIAGQKCGSVVIRHCQRAADSVVVDPNAPPVGQAPAQWEANRGIGMDADSEEVIVTGERIRDAELNKVFERYLGAPPASMVTRKAKGGARCTTITRTGATYCSNSGDVLPGLADPVTQWSFNF